MRRRFLALGLILAAGSGVTTPGPARPTSAAVVDQDYVLALATADRFLAAWQARDQQIGLALISANLKKLHKEDFFRHYLSGVTTPHHAAFEIGPGQRVAPDLFSFPVQLYQHTSGSQWSGPRPSALQIVLRKVGKETWRVDALP